MSFGGTVFADLPFKFEAGTPTLSGCAALAKAVGINSKPPVWNGSPPTKSSCLNTPPAHGREIEDAYIRHSSGKSAIISLLIGSAHSYDTGLLLDKLGIAVRNHHCAQPSP